MAHVIAAPVTESSTLTTSHHELPPFSTPMPVLFGTYVAWLLLAGIVLYIFA